MRIIDPIPVDPILGRSGSEQEIRKYSHHFEEKQKIRVKADGRVGRIENFNARHNVNVRLDSGHLVQYHPDEIEPADWHDSPTAKLQRAIATGAVSVHDQVAIEIALEKIATGSYVVGPFGELESDSPFHTLEVYGEKYGDGSALTKGAEASEESGRGDDPVPAIIKTLKSGGEVTLPSRLQHTCMKHEIMRKLISAGKIHFQETAFI